MAVNGYSLGASVRVTGTFTDSAAAPVDPDVVKARYRPPGGAVVTLIYGTDAALVKDSTGVYHVDIDTTPAHGIWRYRFWSTGNGQAANEFQFTVLASALD